MSFRTRFLTLIVVAVAVLAAVVAAASAADQVIWSNSGNGTISFSALDGSSGGTLTPPGNAPISEPLGLALDSTTGQLYWANSPANGTGAIGFSTLNGTSGGALAIPGTTPLDHPGGIAIDAATRRLYWSNLSDTIAFASLGGADSGLFKPPGATEVAPLGIIVDSLHQRTYWVNRGDVLSSPSIWFADANGSSQLNLPAGAPLSSPRGIAIDPVVQRIYWANINENTIGFADLNGPDTGTLPISPGTTIAHPFGVAIDLVAGRIYWANLDGSVAFESLDGRAGGTLTLPQGAVYSNPAFPLLVVVPVSVAPPELTGGTSAGSQLTCSSGTWAPDVTEALYYRAPQGFSYQWSLNGTDIFGATQSTYTASAGGDYRCRVTARNGAGATAQTTNAYTVSGPPPPVGGSNGGGANGGGNGDATPPLLSAATLSRAGFRAGTGRGHGAVLRLTSSEAARLSIAIERVRPGRKVKTGGRAVCRTVARAVRRGRCTLYVRVTTLTRLIGAGKKSVVLTGLVGRRRLAPGAYRLTITARDASGNASKPVRVAFTILKG